MKLVPILRNTSLIDWSTAIIVVYLSRRPLFQLFFFFQLFQLYPLNELAHHNVSSRHLSS